MSIQDGIGYLRATYNHNLHFTENSDTYANLMYPYIQDDGGNTKNVSLSIDVINSDQNFSTKNDFKQQEWIIDERNNGNLLLDQMIWGFKETTHNTRKSKALSNAFCFSNQTITIKITKQGHLQGYLDNDFLYSRNQLEVSVVDVVRGTEIVLTTFNELETEENNESRSLQWAIPQKSNEAYNNYNFWGLFVFRVKVTSSYYIDANRSVKSNYKDRITNSYLQLLTFDPAQEAVKVQSDLIDIFETNPEPTDSLIQLFNKSIFASLESYNQNPLSNSQKSAIIADQIAVMFMSQHPVVSSDLSPEKIQGFGGELAIQPQKIIEKSITYSERYKTVIQLAQNRLFGMLANYKTFSFANEMNTYFIDTNQSIQNIVDPARIIYMDGSGNLLDDMGVDGILFMPYVIENLHTEILTNVPTANPHSIPLYKYSIGIDTLVVTDWGDEDLACGDDEIKLSFNIVFGEDKIKEICYQTWINNNKEYNEYTDTVGDSREHEFDFSISGGISCTFSGGELTKGDILTARVTILDVYGFSNVFERKLFIPLNNDLLDNVKPAITEITSFQRQDGSGLIDIFYYYKGTTERTPANVSLTYSTNNSSFSSVTTNVIGDIGLGIMPGYRRITWNPTSVLTESNDVVFVKITLTDVDEYSNTGITQSSVVVVDLTTPEVSIRKLSIKEDELMEESSSLSDSSDSSFSSESSTSSEGYSSNSSSELYSDISSSELYSESSSTSSELYSESSSTSSESSEGYSESSSTSSEGYSSHSSSSSENDWEISIIEDALLTMSPSIVIINGHPGIAYIDNSTSYLKYTQYNGYTWDTVTVESEIKATRVSSTIIDGQPAIASYDGDLKYSKYNGITWTNSTIDYSLTGMNPSISNINGQSAIAYYDPINYDLKYAELNGVSWDIETIANIGYNSTYEPAISLADINGQPAIAYQDQSSLDIIYTKYDGVSWNSETIYTGNDSTITDCVSLKLIDGQPAIAYTTFKISENPQSKLYYTRYNGATWDTEHLMVTASAIITASIGEKALNVWNNNPIISYLEYVNWPSKGILTYKIRTIYYNGLSWILETSDGSDVRKGVPSLEIIDGQPAVTYTDWNSKLRFARRDQWPEISSSSSS